MGAKELNPEPLLNGSFFRIRPEDPPEKVLFLANCLLQYVGIKLEPTPDVPTDYQIRKIVKGTVEPLYTVKEILG